MGDDHIAKGQELAKKAENKLHACCPLFGSNFEDAAQLFHKTATFFKLAKSWDKAGPLFVKSAKCHLQITSMMQQMLMWMLHIATRKLPHQDLAASVDEGDVEKFTRVVKEFNSITPLESWKSTLLLRVNDALEVREMEDDDLT